MQSDTRRALWLTTTQTAIVRSALQTSLQQYQDHALKLRDKYPRLANQFAQHAEQVQHIIHIVDGVI